MSTEEKIKPKKSWSRYAKPTLPVEPKKPNETITREIRSALKQITEYSEYLYLGDLDIPDGADWKKVKVELDIDRYDDDATATVNFFLAEEVVEPNTRYKSELKKYEKDLLEYNQALVGYKQELKDWKRWVKQLKEEELEQQIKHAEAFLKKHEKKVK